MFCTTDFNSYLSIRFRIWFFNYFPESRFFARGEVGEKFAQESDLILSARPQHGIIVFTRVFENAIMLTHFYFYIELIKTASFVFSSSECLKTIVYQNDKQKRNSTIKQRASVEYTFTSGDQED